MQPPNTISLDSAIFIEKKKIGESTAAKTRKNYISSVPAAAHWQAQLGGLEKAQPGGGRIWGGLWRLALNIQCCYAPSFNLSTSVDVAASSPCAGMAVPAAAQTQPGWLVMAQRGHRPDGGCK
jgi:hypothetical protein